MIPLIRTVIADDERLARRKLRILLGSEAGVQIVADCQDGKQTIAAVEIHKPDLLFLDIHMPDLDGFQILQNISGMELPVVIFTTAFDHWSKADYLQHIYNDDYVLVDPDWLNSYLEQSGLRLPL